MKIGYARVSTHEQTLDLQIDQLEAADCDPDPIYADKVPGSSPGLERPGLGQALFQICGVFAAFEHNLISERTKAGLAAARARGRKGGRKPKLTPEQLDRAASLMRARQLTVREIARLSGMTPNTLYRHLTPDGQPRHPNGKE